MNTIIIGLKSGRAMAPTVLPLPPAMSCNEYVNNMGVGVCAFLARLDSVS